MNPSILKQAWDQLRQYSSFVLAVHMRPDGDALGAALALAHVLKDLGKDVVVLSQDGVPENYTFLPDSESVLTSTDRRNFDVGMLVDSDGPDRVGRVADAITSARIHACIDHHIPVDEFGSIRVVDPNVSSTCELVYELFAANDISIDSVIGTQLLTGIIFDTGGFKYPNASARTFQIASRLTELGASPSIIAREVLENRPCRALRLLGRALDSIEMNEDGSIAWATIAKRDFDELGASEADTEGIVNTVASVKGPKVVILFREGEPKSIRVSLRSREGFDVNRVAKAFGGGGHAAAAGCTLETTLSEAKESILNEVRRWMES